MSTKVDVSTAALIRAVAGRMARRVVRNERKLYVSLGSKLFPSAPCLPGYSQSKSIPSKLNVMYAARMLFAKVFLLSSEATAEEKCLNIGSVHPARKDSRKVLTDSQSIHRC